MPEIAALARVSQMTRQADPMVASLVLVALVVLAAVSGEAGLGGAIALAAVAVLWFLVNGRMEGPILVVLAPTHGLTGADLAGIAALAVAGWRAGGILRRRRSA